MLLVRVSKQTSRTAASTGVAIEVLSPNFVNTQVQMLDDAEAAVAAQARADVTVPSVERPQTPNTQRAFEALAAVDTLQKQLL